MKIRLMLLSLELKRAIHALPQLLLGAIVLSLLLGTIAFCSGKLLYHTEALSTITIDLVTEEDSKFTDFAIDFIGGMKSTDGLFHFQITSLSDAYADLEKGTASAIIKLPDNLITNILEGTNSPVTVILPDTSALSTLLLQELTSAGAKLLSSAQAGIYTVSDLYLEHGLAASLTEAFRDIDKMNLKYALSRDKLFRFVSTSATGNLTVFTYYAGSAILLFLLLWGISCSHFLGKETSAFYQKLRTSSISLSAYLLVKWLTIFVTFLIILSGLLCITFSVNAMTHYTEWIWNWTVLLSFLPVLLFVSAFILCIYQISKSAGNGILLLFISSVLLLFLSGAFIPLAFFPPLLRHLSAWLPTTIAMRQLSNICIAEPSASFSYVLVFFSLALYGCSVWILSQKEGRHV